MTAMWLPVLAYLVSVATLGTPEGTSSKAQGASPGIEHQNSESPEGATQNRPSSSYMSPCDTTQPSSRPNCFAPAGLHCLLCLFPRLAPWAFLLRPFGASFATETS